MDNPMLAELDEVVRPDAWAWRSDGMTGWALGHIRPTPENTHKFHERNTAVRGLYFAETLHAPLADMAKRLEVLQSLAAAMYQAAGAYDMPVRFLDVLSAAGNGEAITEAQVDALLPCETPDTLQRLEAAERDARRWRHARKLLTADDIEGAQGSYDSFGGIVSEDECKRADAAIDATQEGEG